MRLAQLDMTNRCTYAGADSGGDKPPPPPQAGNILIALLCYVWKWLFVWLRHLSPPPSAPPMANVWIYHRYVCTCVRNTDSPGCSSVQYSTALRRTTCCHRWIDACTCQWGSFFTIVVSYLLVPQNLIRYGHTLEFRTSFHPLNTVFYLLSLWVNCVVSGFSTSNFVLLYHVIVMHTQYTVNLTKLISLSSYCFVKHVVFCSATKTGFVDSLLYTGDPDIAKSSLNDGWRWRQRQNSRACSNNWPSTHCRGFCGKPQASAFLASRPGVGVIWGPLKYRDPPSLFP